MAKYAKWIGAGLGFVFGRLLGAVLGYYIGSLIDGATSDNTISYDDESDNNPYQSSRTGNIGHGDFIAAFSMLATAIMMADGVMKRSELNYVKDVIGNFFGESSKIEALRLIRELSSKQIPVESVCEKVRQMMSISDRINLFYYLVGIAKADGKVSKEELILLEKIGYAIGLNQSYINSTLAMYREDEDSDYEILGISKDATDAEVKKAYRKMAIENHPDKVSHLGDDIRKSAEEKFKKINIAYEKICKERGIK